ncbi:rCG56043 [Rattus norvegicus]
MPFGG